MTAQQVLIPETDDNWKKETEALVPLTPWALIERATAQNVSADTIAKLWEIAKEVEANDARKAFADAMSKFKANPPKLDRNKHVNYSKVDYWHITLDHAVELIAPCLNEVGIFHRYETDVKEGLIYVTCILTHKQGHSERTTLFGLPDDTGGKNKIQAIGSTVYYLERYTLLAATGLAPEGKDNDGAGSEGGQLDSLDQRLEEIAKARDERALMAIFKAHHEAATKAGDGIALLKITQAKDKRKGELQ